MTEPIDRSVLATIRGCQNRDILSGICCTKNCAARHTCHISRTKLIIPGITINTDKTSIQEIDFQETPGLSITMNSIRPDGYLNECTGMFTSEATN
jgi:hypothetical protein